MVHGEAPGSVWREDSYWPEAQILMGNSCVDPHLWCHDRSEERDYLRRSRKANGRVGDWGGETKQTQLWSVGSVRW